MKFRKCIAFRTQTPMEFFFQRDPRNIWIFQYFNALLVRKSKSSQFVSLTSSLAGAASAAILTFPSYIYKTLGQSGLPIKWSVLLPPWTGRLPLGTVTGMTLGRGGAFFLAPEVKALLNQFGADKNVASVISSVTVPMIIPFCTEPLLRSSIQAQLPQSPYASRSMLVTILKIFKAEGISGLYKGLIPEIVKNGPKQGVILFTKDWLENSLFYKSWFSADQRQVRDVSNSLIPAVLGAWIANPFEVIRNDVIRNSKKGKGMVEIVMTGIRESGSFWKYATRGLKANTIGTVIPYSFTIYLTYQYKRWLESKKS